MSLPARSRVWSASSLPGTAGSGICFTQTAMFMSWSTPQASGRADRAGRRARPDSCLAMRSMFQTGRRVPIGPVPSNGDIDGRRRRARRRRRTGRDRRRHRSPPPRARRASSSTRPGFPRDKTCGDGLTTGALRARGLGLDVRDAAVVRAGHRDRARLAERPRGRAPAPGRRRRTRAWCPRAELDAALVDRARARAASTVRDGVGVTASSPTTDDVTRRPRRRHRRVRRAVGGRRRRPLLPRAPHARRRRRRATRLASELGTWHAFRQYFRGVDDRAAVGAVRRRPPARVRVGVPRRRRPRQRRASACCATARSGARSGQGSSPRSGATSLDRPERARHPRARRRARRHAPRLADPRVVRRARASRDGRVLFAGDAANVVDPMTGEGIAQALETGDARGARHRSVDRDADGRRRAVPPRRRPRARRRPALRRARSSTCCASPLGARAAIARRRRSRRGPAATSPAGCSRTIPARACSRPRRWHRGMFTGSGAYADG